MEYRLKYKGKEIDDRLDLAGTAIQEHQDISGLATKEEVSKLDEKYQEKGDYALRSELPQVPTKVSELKNDKGYITKEDIPEVEIPDNIATIEEVAKKQDKLVSGSNIKTINGQSILGNGDIVIKVGEDVDLSGYVTKVDADKIYQPKGNYALEDDIPINVSELSNDAKYITIEQVPTVDLTGYAKKEDIPTIPTKVSSFDNDKGYITIDDVTPYDDTEIKNQIASKVDANFVNSAINSAITNTLNTEV